MGSHGRLLVRALGGLLILAVLVPAGASAQQARTYVDRANGSDANDCLYETPCLSFQRAHDVTVPNGEINVKTPGNYSSLTITKPITIDGSGTVATITPFGAGVTVNLPEGGRVVLRDLRINAAANFGTHGIDVLSNARVYVDNLRIFGGSIAGIRLSATNKSAKLIVDDSKIHGASGAGVRLAPAGGVARATIRDTRIDDNDGPGVVLRPTAGATARATVRGSHIESNFNGLVADSQSGGTAILNVFNTGITDSGLDSGGPGVGVYAGGGNATARISNNEIQHNRRGLQAVAGGKILTAGDNIIFGNITNGASTGSWTRE
jgi:hypothetical protein